MKLTIVALTTVLLLLSCGQRNENPFRIGQMSVLLVDESRDRPLHTEIWYPTLDSSNNKASSKKQKDIFKTIETIPNATIANETFPLLLVSHGTGGNRFSLTWFIEQMVKAGYIVVSLDHYGNSTFNKIPREFVKWWERAIDVQFVLTQVLNNKTIGKHIDPSRIGGAGFSLGGYTNIALAGGYVDRSFMSNNIVKKELPPEFPKSDEAIDLVNDSLIISSYNRYKAMVKDNRIKAFFTMAPAVGLGFHSKNQTDNITAPIFIVAGQEDSNTPIKHNAENYHDLIETSELHILNGNVGHYVFLNEATAFGKEVAPAITVDNEGVDRKQIHQTVSKMALNFFNKHLRTSSK